MRSFSHKEMNGSPEEKILFVLRSMNHSTSEWNEGSIITSEGNIYDFDISEKYGDFSKIIEKEFPNILKTIIHDNNPSKQCKKEDILNAYQLVNQIDKKKCEFVGFYTERLTEGKDMFCVFIDEQIIPLIMDFNIHGAVDCPEIFQIYKILESNGIYTSVFLKEHKDFRQVRKMKDFNPFNPFDQEQETIECPKYKVNIDDYNILERIDIGFITFGKSYEYKLYRAIDKKSKKEVSFNVYMCGYKVKKGNPKNIYVLSSLFNLKGTVNVIALQAQLSNEEKKKLKCYNEHNSTDNYAIIITELMKVQRVEILNSKFISSEGKFCDQINPTIRSKIIFGIAAIMKKLHKEGVYIWHFFGNVCLDDNLEPRIRLDSWKYFDLNSVDIVSLCLCYEGIFDPIIPPGHDLEYADVYNFAWFVCSMFTDAIDEHDFTTRYYGKKSNEFSNIPCQYMELLEKCWNYDEYKRPTFEEIVEILKNDKFALDEFSLKTNLDELHEYQNRIDKD